MQSAVLKFCATLPLILAPFGGVMAHPDHASGQPVALQDKPALDTAPMSQMDEDATPRYYESAAPGASALQQLEDQFFDFFGGNQLKWVYFDLLTLSDLPMPLPVCFRNGSGGAWRMIERVAKEWEVEGSSLEFEFRTERGDFRECKHNPGIIKVRLGGRSNWSAVGKQAAEERFADASMNIAFDYMRGFERRGAILHEFGHALGLQHEHLNSNGDCESQINIDKVVKILRAEGNPRTRSQIERDFVRKFEGNRVSESEFDDESVMLYALRRDFFERPDEATCIYPLRNQLSDLDEEVIRLLFPTDRQDALNYKLAGFEFVRSRLATSGLEPEVSTKAISFISAYYPFSEPAARAPFAKNTSAILAEKMSEMQADMPDE